VYFRSIEEDRTIAADDARTDERTSEFSRDYLVPLGITSMLDAPIRRAGKLVGVICHEHVGPPRSWTLEDQAFAGSVADFVAMTLDAHERRRTEARQALLVRELDHRVKNNLATVLSLAERTIASSRTLHEFGPSFAGRIRALAVAHELLANSNWQGADLETMIHRCVAPAKRAGYGTIEVIGPQLQLSASLAPSLCLILHELASNATRYGALSARDGTVRIGWEQQTMRPGGERLRLTWMESEGPPVVPPSGHGFGLELVEGIATHQLHGAAKVIFDRSGVSCELHIPLDHPHPQTSAAAGSPDAHSSIVSTVDSASHRMDGKRILLVEDDFLVASTLSSALAAAGCDVIGPASTVDEACRLIKLEPVDAAVLDINLSPGTSAPIARSLQYRGCPFLFVTGYSNISMLPDELRGYRVLAKPVDGRALCEAVHRLTQGAQAAAAN
jgi:two-component sensor histidine kinase/ActR/RegA family two-component response regulator